MKTNGGCQSGWVLILGELERVRIRTEVRRRTGLVFCTESFEFVLGGLSGRENRTLIFRRRRWETGSPWNVYRFLPVVLGSLEKLNVLMGSST